MEITPEYDLFRDFALEDTLDRLREVWDLSHALPLPRTEIRCCPQCEAGGAIVRRWRFHRRETSPNPWRCDVMFKCVRCGLAWTHGLVVPQAMYEAHPDETLERREAEAVLENSEGWEG